MNRLVLIDGHAILHRAYHALPPLTISNGQMINAVYGFTSMLLRVVTELAPLYLVVAFDRPEPTFRNKLYKNYQIQRPKADEEFISQIDLVKRVVEEMGIPIFEKAGFEADDLLGTIAKKATSKNTIDEVIIVTGDRDILQLVNERVKVYMPVKGLSESKLYGEKEVEEKFGVKPSQIVDYKALVGDQSDNYPGVDGIGPKTASNLLSRFTSLEQLYRHLESIENEGLRKKLAEGIKEAELAKKLASIVTDIPIEINLEKCKLQNLDRPNVHKLFEELEFRSLIPRLSPKNRQQTTDNMKHIINNKKEKKGEQISLF